MTPDPSSAVIQHSIDECRTPGWAMCLGSPQNEDALERRIAVEAIARALGEPLGETINADKGDTPCETWAQNITARGAARLAEECA